MAIFFLGGGGVWLLEQKLDCGFKYFFRSFTPNLGKGEHGEKQYENIWGIGAYSID